MATPHIGAEPGDLAPDVLMPGDPRRAQRIAETVLTDARLVTEVRGILGYTGTFDGRPVSVLASGMGIPSISIYATELYRFFDVQRIIRIGTAGGMATHLDVGDVVIASAAHTDSSVSANRIPGMHYSHAPSFSLMAAAAAAGGVGPGQAQPARPKDAKDGKEGKDGAARRRRRTRGGQVYVGPVLSSDVFYANRPATMDALVAHGTLAVEMEAAGLYAVADQERREALAICTISDLLFKDVALSAAERELLFDRSVALGLAAFADG
jgi:purine-nucleoside phosphorylase